jgi:hypothetical protein
LTKQFEDVAQLFHSVSRHGIRVKVRDIVTNVAEFIEPIDEGCAIRQLRLAG